MQKTTSLTQGRGDDNLEAYKNIYFSAGGK